MNMEMRLQSYGDVECRVSLFRQTTFRIGGAYKYFTYPKNELCLPQVLDILEEEGIPYRISGKGSNVLYSDDDYEGAILCLDRYFTDFFFGEEGSCLVQAGVSIIMLIHEAMKKSFSGLEFASGISSTLGGAVFMNADAYKSDISQILKEVYTLKDHSIVVMYVEELECICHHSIFQSRRDWITLGAGLQLQLGDQREIRSLVDSRKKCRMDLRSLDRPCAGNMFHNPKDHQAWQLTEGISMYGTRIGGAMALKKYANFIVNEDHAEVEDVVQSVEVIQKEIQDRFGVELITEVEKFDREIQTIFSMMTSKRNIWPSRMRKRTVGGKSERSDY